MPEPRQKVTSEHNLPAEQYSSEMLFNGVLYRAGLDSESSIHSNDPSQEQREIIMRLYLLVLK